MSAKHTPGPWEVLEGLRTVVRGAGRQKIAEITVPYGDDLRGHILTKANARLTAAAPDLLAALDRAEAFIAGFEDDETQEGVAEMLAAIRAAIAKAKEIV